MISFREVKISDAEQILNWRTERRITQYMTTDVEFNINNQINWLKGCYNKKNYYHWIVQCNNVDIGIISLSDYDSENKTTSWGFYIGNDDYLGSGAFIPLYFYNFIFNELNIEKITAEVFYDNTKTIKLHLFHGYKFEPKNSRAINKNGRDIYLVGMSLRKNDFFLKKKDKYRCSFPMLEWRRDV